MINNEGFIRALATVEVELLKEKIVIKARPYNGNLLDTKILEESDALPFYEINAGDRKVYVSVPYRKNNHISFVGYIESGNSIIARTFFYSRSEGVARLLRRYKFIEVVMENGEKGDKVTWNDKGYSEKSIALCMPLQKGLAEILSKYMVLDKESSIQKLDLKKLGGNIFYGTAYDVSHEDDYMTEVDKDAIKMEGYFYSENKKVLVVPEDMIFTNKEQAPDFSIHLDQWSVYLESYGMTTVSIFKSYDSNFLYLFNTDSEGRTWIGQIDNLSEVTSLGLRTKWVDSGCLTTPAWEYLIDDMDQTGGYGDVLKRQGSYVDMYRNYISKIPVVNKYVIEYLNTAKVSLQ